jgi:hypothetical protein
VGVQLQTKPGQNVVLVGSHPSMGSWSLDGALPMTWTDGHVWKASIEVPADSMDLEYKVRLAAGQLQALCSNTVWFGQKLDRAVEVFVGADVERSGGSCPSDGRQLVG